MHVACTRTLERVLTILTTHVREGAHVDCHEQLHVQLRRQRMDGGGAVERAYLGGTEEVVIEGVDTVAKVVGYSFEIEKAVDQLELAALRLRHLTHADTGKSAHTYAHAHTHVRAYTCTRMNVHIGTSTPHALQYNAMHISVTASTEWTAEVAEETTRASIATPTSILNGMYIYTRQRVCAHAMPCACHAHAHAHSMHMPCTCHAHAMHMHVPSTCHVPADGEYRLDDRVGVDVARHDASQ